MVPRLFIPAEKIIQTEEIIMKRILAIFMCVLMFAGTGITAHAEHYNPIDKSPCSNIHYKLQDDVVLHTSNGTHNYVCTVTYYIYSHKKYCSSCGAFLGAGPGFQCTEIHTCPTYIKNCYGTY